MHLTIHGVERLQERTQMTAGEVLELIKEKIYIYLGTSEKMGMKYLLFYSRWDHRCKIAVVSLEKETLVSVWNASYYLPDGVEKVSQGHRDKARDLYWEYFYRIHPQLERPKRESSPPPPLVEPLRFKIEVKKGEEKEYEHELEVEGVVSSHFDNLWPMLVSTFREIAPIVEDYKKKIPTRVSYMVEMFRGGSRRPYRYFLLNHGTIMRRLKAA